MFKRNKPKLFTKSENCTILIKAVWDQSITEFFNDINQTQWRLLKEFIIFKVRGEKRIVGKYLYKSKNSLTKLDY